MELMTVGYEGLKLDEFIERLQGKQVKVVADVRLNPISRKPGFSKTSLSKALSDKGIEYVHFGSLGTPKDIREKFKKSKDRKSFRSDYESFLSNRKEAIFELYKLITKSKVAIMCFEKDEKECHRSILLGKIKTINHDGLKVDVF